MPQVHPVQQDLIQKDESPRNKCHWISICFGFVGICATTLGIFPIKWNKSANTHSFKLLSFSSLFAFFRLVISNFPFSILPVIFLLGGISNEEYQKFVVSTNGTANGTERMHDYGSIMYIVNYVEHSLNLLYFILPFLFAYNMVKPWSKFNEIFTENDELKKSQNYVSAIPPLLGFFVFLIGKAMVCLEYLLLYARLFPNFSQMPITQFTVVSYFLMSPLGLQFLLSVYEFFFYMCLKMFNIFSTIYLEVVEKSEIFLLTEKLICMIDSFKNTFRFFLLVDLTLMMLYWIIHLYNTFSEFKLGLIISGLGSVLIIMAEFLRLMFLTTACSKFTERIDQIINKLEELKSTLGDEDRRVRKLYFITLNFISCV